MSGGSTSQLSNMGTGSLYSCVWLYGHFESVKGDLLPVVCVQQFLSLEMTHILMRNEYVWLQKKKQDPIE